MAGPVPSAWLQGCTAAHRRLDALTTRVSDEIVTRPSLLPDWTVGHLLTHLCRNADSVTGMLQAAQRGDVTAQYPGGPQQREAEIVAGSTRPAAELAADVTAAHGRLEQAWAATAADVWATGLGIVSSGPRTVAEQVFRRWREVEIHLVDLGLTELGGPDWDTVASAYLDTEWEWTVAGVPARLAADHTLVLVPGDRPSRAFGNGPQRVVVRAAPGRILRWLLGRGGDESWPDLRRWD